MIRRKKLFFLGLSFTLVGLLGVVPTFYYRAKNQVAVNNAQVVTPVVQPQLAPKVTTGRPVGLIMNDLGLKLSVVDGTYNERTGQWSLSNSKAHYALLTTPPNNEQGNTLIYGHYRPEVFARLKRAQPGNEAIVETENGYRFIYKFSSTRSVSPTDTSLFSYQGPPMLTLQTCSGAWMQNRQLYSFDFVRYEKI